MSAWVDLIDVAALEPGDVTPVSLGARRLAVYDSPDGVYVTAALCTHAGAPLCDGYFDGWRIECPLHQGLFDIRDGRPIGAPVVKPLKTFQSRVKDGAVQILI
ncbi:MAG: non-heme iron oxygenase ferredoxin subunit [Pseudomonadota bacterium]